MSNKNQFFILLILLILIVYALSRKESFVAKNERANQIHSGLKNQTKFPSFTNYKKLTGDGDSVEYRAVHEEFNNGIFDVKSIEGRL